MDTVTVFALLTVLLKNKLLNDGEKCEISLDNDMSNEESLEEDEELEL